MRAITQLHRRSAQNKVAIAQHDLTWVIAARRLDMRRTRRGAELPLWDRNAVRDCGLMTKHGLARSIS